MYLLPHVFHHHNNATVSFSLSSFSPSISPLPSTSSLQSSLQLECTDYNSYIEEEFEDDETANQQENEENNFLVGSQNILNSLRE